jgi:hypothetical protein
MKRVLSITRSPTNPLRERVVHPRDPFGRRRPSRIDLRKACACDGFADVDVKSPPITLADAAAADVVAPPIPSALGDGLDCVCACDASFADVDSRAGVGDGAVVNAALGDVPVQVVEAPAEAVVDVAVAAPPLAGADAVAPPPSSPAPADAGPADGAAL